LKLLANTTLVQTVPQAAMIWINGLHRLFNTDRQGEHQLALKKSEAIDWDAWQRRRMEK
jgi:hypothetical protein